VLRLLYIQTPNGCLKNLWVIDRNNHITQINGITILRLAPYTIQQQERLLIQPLVSQCQCQAMQCRRFPLIFETWEPEERMPNVDPMRMRLWQRLVEFRFLALEASDRVSIRRMVS